VKKDLAHNKKILDALNENTEIAVSRSEKGSMDDAFLISKGRNCCENHLISHFFLRFDPIWQKTYQQGFAKDRTKDNFEKY
jgi:hypothetical protein